MNAQTIDGITIDLNRATRRDFREYMAALKEAQAGGDMDAGDAARAVFYGKIVTGWPFGDTAYQDLGIIDAKRMDDAVNEAMEIIAKKKSEPSLTPPGASAGA